MNKRTSAGRSLLVRSLDVLKKPFAVAALWFGISPVASAHVKWFIEQELIAQGGDLRFSIADPAVQIWGLIFITVIGVAIWLDPFIKDPPRKFVAWGERRRGDVIRLAQLLVGVPLLISAAQGSILAPHLMGDGPLIVVLQLIEGLAAVLLIANIWMPIALGLLILLFIGVLPAFGVVPPMEYFNILGIAVFLSLISVSDGHPLAQYRPWALPLLRVNLGIVLIVLALTEKLLHPGLAMQFLAQYDVNFMGASGIPFSNKLFVLSAGYCEALFGIIFVLGLVTRVNILSLAVFLVASNTYFFVTGYPALGVKELIGHSPLFAAAIIFIVYGGGEKLKLSALIGFWTKAPVLRAPGHARNFRKSKGASIGSQTIRQSKEAINGVAH